MTLVALFLVQSNIKKVTQFDKHLRSQKLTSSEDSEPRERDLDRLTLLAAPGKKGDEIIQI